MSSYPGEGSPSAEDRNPDDQRPDDQRPDDQPAEPGTTAADTEPTQPMGYWERQAAEQAREQRQQGDPFAAAPPGPGLHPQTPYGQQPYGQQYPQPPYDQQYPQPPYGQQYPQPPYGQQYPPPPGQPPYAPAPPGYPPAPGQGGPPFGQPGGHPGMAPYGYPQSRPDHPQATLALVLGIIGLVGGVVLCGVGLLASPFAWAIGRNALKEIRASQGRLGGETQARTGMITGIIGTAFLALAVVGLIAFALVVAVSGSTSGSSV